MQGVLMPRSRRSSLGGFCYHILNRGNKKAQVFHDEEDYQQFESLIGEANRRVSFRMLAFCLMPNHFHLRANLVFSAEDWRWSSLYHSVAGSTVPGLTEGPAVKPGDWTKFVNTALTTAELSDLRRCVQRQRPYGGTEWVKDTADRMGLEFSLRSMEGGRPRVGKTRKVPKKEL